MLHHLFGDQRSSLCARVRCGLLMGVAVAACAWLPGCATGGAEAAAAGTGPGASGVSFPPAEARSLPVYRGKVGSVMSWNELVSQASAADVVIIGENHGHPIGLPWVATLFDDVLKKAPTTALAMEFLERDEQTRVDDYLLGLTDEATFLKRTGRTLAAGGNYPPGHRRMVDAARAAGRPVVAANAPRTIIRYLRGKTYDDLGQLTAEQRRLFRVPEAAPQGRYRADFDAIMTAMSTESHGGREGGGGDGPSAAATTVADSPPVVPKPKPPSLTPEQSARFDAKFRGHQLWDWTMAESVTRAVDKGNHPIVLVVGRFHSDFFGGTPQAIAMLRPNTTILTVSVVDRSAASLNDDDRDRADLVVYVGQFAEDDAENK